MRIENLKKFIRKLPQSPGVYFFKNAKKEILYIGKAVNLKNRVSSYFFGAHARRIEQMLSHASTLEWKETKSAIEALILEANLIRRHQPKYNAMQKDDKTFVEIGITLEDFPKVTVVRRTGIIKNKRQKTKYKKLFGPFPSALSAKTAIKILRRIFPFRTHCKPKTGRKCLDAHIGLCPGVCSGDISKEEYAKTIHHLILFFEGGEKRVAREIEREMKAAAKKEDFENAARLRNQILALRHIHDVALMKDENFGYFHTAAAQHVGRLPGIPERIEAYDISHTGGMYTVGSMVVFTNGKIDTDEYRQFRIRMEKGVNDVAHMEEVLERRLAHTEWSLPDVIVVDGGLAQLRAAKNALQQYVLRIPVIALAKGPTRKGKKIYSTCNAPALDIKVLEGLRDEAHRFAISYHRKLRRKNFLKK